MKILESIFRWTGRGALLIVILLTPWCLGGVYPVTQYWLAFGIASALGCATLAELLSPSPRWKIPMLVLPLLLALGIGLFQLVPLDRSLRKKISPWIVEWDQALQSEETDTDHQLQMYLGLPPRAEQQAISANPAATRYGVAFFTLALGGLVGGIYLFRERSSMVLLMAAVGINGCAIALFSIVQKLAWNGYIYWYFESPNNEATCLGPFVNRNNGSGFLLICLGMSLGWLLYSLTRKHVMKWETFSSPSSKRRTGLMKRFDLLDTGHFMQFILLGAIAGGILASISRGGCLSLCFATAAVAAVLAIVTRRMVWSGVMILMLGGGIFLLFWIEWDSRLLERLQSLSESEIMEEENNLRLMNWSDALQVLPETPWVGSGLMTYEYVYRPYQEIYTQRRFAHAENFYVQTWVETGYLGFSLLVLGLLFTIGYIVRLIRSSDGWRKAIGVGGIFVMVSQLSSSMFDFGLHLPANILTLSVFMGGIASLSLSGRSGERETDRRYGDRIAWWGHAVFPAGILFLCFFAIEELDDAATADRARRQARKVTRAVEKTLENNPPIERHVEDREIEAALTAIDHALQERPDDAWLHIHASKLLMEQFRRAEKSGDDETAAPSEGTQKTGPTALTIFQWTQLYHQYGLESSLEDLRNKETVEKYVVEAMRHAILARRACPFLEMPHHLLAQLVGLVGSANDYQRHLDRAVLAYPSDPEVQFLAGVLQYAVGDIEEAIDHWRKSLEQSSEYREWILELADPQAQAPAEFLARLFPGDPSLLFWLALQHYSENPSAKEHLLNRALANVPQNGKASSPKQQYLLSQIHWHLGREDEAVEHLEQAMLLDPRKTQWRYILASRLHELGHIEEARRQAKLCVREEPNREQYRRLLRELTRTELLAAPDGQSSEEETNRKP